MKESVGYTVTLNIVITFIIIVFAFLSAILVYFKSNKASNIITDSIEEHEGYNLIAQSEIQTKLSSLGYNANQVNCEKHYNKIGVSERLNSCTHDLNYADNKYGLTDGSSGYCVFLCKENFENECYYYYKISTNMMMNIPIINDLLNIPIFSNTNRLYDFEDQNSCK